MHLLISVDGHWEDWSEWGECSVTCNGGFQWRLRICVQPLNGGADCIGSMSESRECGTVNCPSMLN